MRTTVFIAAAVATACAQSGGTPCDNPDTDNAKCSCNGVEYDFSQIQPSDGNSYFSGPDANNEYMYYFQMTGGGLPSDDGSMPYCTFASGSENGNAAGQGEITGDSCFPIGQVTQQQWSLDTTQNPQVIQIIFSGGQEGRQAELSVTCDPSADDPTFSVKGETRTLVYEMDITSKFACASSPSPGPPTPPTPGPPTPPTPGPPSRSHKKKSGLGGGGLLLVIIFPLGICYFVGMAIYTKKQTGELAMPHKDKFGEFFGLAKEGARFIKSKATKSEYQPL